MAKISMSGASDSLADPDYIAPPGVSPSDGIVAGLRSTGDQDRDEEIKARQDHAEQMAERARDNDESGQDGEQRTEGGQRSTADAGSNDVASSTSTRTAGRASTDAGKNDTKSGKTTR